MRGGGSEEACGLNYTIKCNKLQQQMACQFTAYIKLLDASRVVVKHMKLDSIQCTCTCSILGQVYMYLQHIGSSVHVLAAYWVKCICTCSILGQVYLVIVSFFPFLTFMWS